MIIKQSQKITPLAQLEEAQNIRKSLELAIEQAQDFYNKTRDDHRYAQGFLHGLVQFQDLITKTESLVSSRDKREA